MDLATIDRLLTTTRSVRRRLDFSRPVPLELIETCLAIAIQAPTGSNQQGWHFVVITDPPLKQALAKVYRTGYIARRTRPAHLRPYYEPADPRSEQRPALLK